MASGIMAKNKTSDKVAHYLASKKKMENNIKKKLFNWDRYTMK